MTASSCRPTYDHRRVSSWLHGALRPMLLAIVALALVGPGGVELAPRGGAAIGIQAAAGPAGPALLRSAPALRTAPAATRTDSGPPASLRAVALSVGTATPAKAALPPPDRPVPALHLVAAPQPPPPTTTLPSAPVGGPDGRAPPGPTGT